jgi:hypothetical protein
MKHVIYGGEPLVTGSAVADALLEYSMVVVRNGTSVPVTIPILSANGSIEQRSILLGPATQLETQDVDGSNDEEEARFPVPRFPAVGGKGIPADLDPLPELPEHLR